MCSQDFHAVVIVPFIEAFLFYGELEFLVSYMAEMWFFDSLILYLKKIMLPLNILWTCGTRLLVAVNHYRRVTTFIYFLDV